MADITPEERRRVAEALMDPWDIPPFHQADEDPGTTYWRVFVDWLTGVVGLAPRHTSFAALQERLAALIDPTCVAIARHYTGSGRGGYDVYTCSVCGTRLGERKAFERACLPGCCPGCGSRVTGKEDA